MSSRWGLRVSQKNRLIPTGWYNVLCFLLVVCPRDFLSEIPKGHSKGGKLTRRKKTLPTRIR